jgi:hypothetical protein
MSPYFVPERDHTEECRRCGHTVKYHDVAPPVDDDDAWQDIREEHAPDCEWAATRGYRLSDE